MELTRLQESRIKRNLNQARILTRDEMIDMLGSKYSMKNIRTSEEFDGEKDGLWMAGNHDIMMPNGKDKIFDYYNDRSIYKGGIHKDFVNFLKNRGWYGHFHDPGTVMLFPEN